MIVAALCLLPLFWMGFIPRLAGVALVAGLAFYLAWAYLAPRGTPEPDVAARLLVDGAVNIAQAFGLSEAFIGRTIVAVGTSLPELATSCIAAVRRQPDIAIGNIVGSNIFNVLGILGATAIITPIPVADRFLVLDLPVMLPRRVCSPCCCWCSRASGAAAAQRCCWPMVPICGLRRDDPSRFA